MRYFDCTKFDYQKFGIEESDELVLRDKNAYKHSFLSWVNNEIDNIVERKWEIENIGVVEETGDFIRLIKESELSYSLGAYYSVIALVGVACEDLCKYFANKKGYSSLIKKTQCIRVKELKSLGVIDNSLFDKFDYIRKIRNDSLHFNEDFKSKDRIDLKIDALICLNKLKEIYKTLFSSFNASHVKGESIKQLIKDFAQQTAFDTSFGDTLNQEEFTMKLRYFMADEFDMDIAISESGSLIKRGGIFTVLELDLTSSPKEMTLSDRAVGSFVVVDLTNENAKNLVSAKVKENSSIVASIYSTTDHQGITAAWNLDSFFTI